MKNRLLRIRISQALLHCNEFTQAEWRIVCVHVRVYVCGEEGVGVSAACRNMHDISEEIAYLF